MIIFRLQRGRLQRKNIRSFKPGPTACATSIITESSPLSLFRVLFDKAILRNIRKWIVAEAHCVSGRMNWNMTLDELEKFIGLVIAKGILEQRGLPVESLWDTTWWCLMFNKTLSRSRFKEIMRFLLFAVKSERRKRVILASFAWFPRCGNLLLRTLRRRMCLVLTLQMTNNYFHVRLDAGLFNTYRINLKSLESTSGWQLMWIQNTIAFRIWGKIRAGILL